MQGGEDEMARLGGFEREGNGFQIAHFAHEDDVRVLTQGGAQGRAEGARIAPDLALVDEAAFGPVHKFDGVFDGDDVIMAVRVGVIHERGEGGGLAASGGPGDEDEPFGEEGQLPQHGRKPQFLHAVDALRDFAEHGGHAPVLPEKVGAVAREAGDFIGEIQIAALFESLHPLHGNHFTQYGHEFFAAYGGGVHADQIAVDTQDGRTACGKVEV